MIDKPNVDLRKRFWRADAWKAACAEPMFHWVVAGSRYPRVVKSIWIGWIVCFSIALIIRGQIGLLIIMLLIGWLAAMAIAMLRRVLLYFSILRYGTWQEMPSEIRAVLEQSSDMALSPDNFRPLPPGFTPLDPHSAQPQPRKQNWYDKPAISRPLSALLLMILQYVMLASEDPTAIALLIFIFCAFYFWWHVSKARRKPERS